MTSIKITNSPVFIENVVYTCIYIHTLTNYYIFIGVGSFLWLRGGVKVEANA